MIMIIIINGNYVEFNTCRRQEIVRRIKLPMQHPTGMIFGGQNLDTLFVTSTIISVDFFTNVQSAPVGAPAGNLFKIDGLGVRGIPSVRPIL